jgi:hypothetical protein
MVYPGTGVPNSTGTAWGTSYAVGSGANDLPQLNGSGVLLASELPVPSASTLGGVESLSVVAHNFLTGISTSGVPSQAQPAFTDISGSLGCSQHPALTGDATMSAGTCATSVVALNGISLAGLSTGLLYNTNSTGVPSIATSSQILSACSGCAPLASPTFTGTPSLPTGTTGVTQALSVNNTTLATTAYVNSYSPSTSFFNVGAGAGSGTAFIGTAGSTFLEGFLLPPHLPTLITCSTTSLRQTTPRTLTISEFIALRVRYFAAWARRREPRSVRQPDLRLFLFLLLAIFQQEFSTWRLKLSPQTP